MKRDRIVLCLMAAWLIGWIVLSWPAIQDDALIHLRYADNLRRHHIITYNGVDPNFGTSSLLYVGILAAASAAIRSPELPRLVSSLFHLVLFGGLAWLFAAKLRRGSRVAEISSLMLIALLIAPCSIRWLDDGMETGLVLCATSCVAWLAFDESRRPDTTRGRFAVLLVLGYLLVLLRSELALLAGFAFLAIVAVRVRSSGERSLRSVVRAAASASHLLIGVLLASATVLLTMGVLLPDTAAAKAEGLHAWKNVLIATAVVLASSRSVGVGLAIFWLMTFAIVILRRRADAATVIANGVFPVLLLLTTLRGQAVQGVRYLLWAMLFPAIWNVLRLGLADNEEERALLWPVSLVYAFALLLLINLPFESKEMYRVLTDRARTMRAFEAQHLDQLGDLRGAAMDIGYIGFFTHADICDMSGLVNGPAVARLNPQARAQRCVEEHPDFIFGNPSHLRTVNRYLDIREWQICSSYDFGNVRTPDTHYLIARSSSAERVCHAAESSAGPDRVVPTNLPEVLATP